MARLKQAQAKAEAAATAAAEKIWHFDAALKPAPGEIKEGYALIPAGAKDTQKVIDTYLHGPVPGYDIKSVKIIYNPTLNRTFALRLQLLQERARNPAFTPK